MDSFIKNYSGAIVPGGNELNPNLITRSKNTGNYLSPNEVATRYNVTTRTVYNWIKEDKLPGFQKIGGSWRINEDDLF